MYTARNPLDYLKNYFRSGSMPAILILVNVGVWILTKAVYVIFFLFNHPDTAVADSWILHYFALPASAPEFASRPWTLLSYMFLHLDFWHILFNMLWLFWFARIFMEYLNSRQLLFTYIFGGIAGGLLYFAAFNIFPVFQASLPVSVALGASASVMAIVTAIAFYVPDYSIQLLFIGRIRILYLAIILFVFDFFAIPTGNSGGHLAHIGGALFGYFFSLWIRKTKYSYGQGVFTSLFMKVRNLFRPRLRVSQPSPDQGRAKTDDEYNVEKRMNQERIDRILEKISRGGYDSLTKEEKELLFRSSGKKN
ncbi:MAG: rhomboid family intramembrane serine protease [Bacteroidetes bacterium]|nr:rhomboid family intramembrane serine protease [Bacteroidota bacterium]